MTNDQLIQLNNPVWHALQTVHRHFAAGTALAQRYPADVVPFIAGKNAAPGLLHEMTPLVAAGETVYLVGEFPAAIPAMWQQGNRLNCLQMICPVLIAPRTDSEINVLQLTPADKTDMLTLINLVQPGFFKSRTAEMGNYYGIRANGRLVAMAGERLKMQGITEVSAVVTHPDFTGRGYAQQLVAHVCKNIHTQQALPFLQVLSANAHAIRIYEKLGFVKHREIAFWQLIKL
ncbi:GNAT family N-acetyltransferase [Deminuibacter soli]|uniref:GNAT family N-acetyltransferase n=1 Tax=Deminuibacter soli TaxID=2291815 RepID=A0A3E1NDL6_9BACT|nr:GNAT family N-acetyltransferase [Deminuibacter soli]RFM25967.1 GNAT family N-acetyltransferase [Deminuibacter soli]